MNTVDLSPATLASEAAVSMDVRQPSRVLIVDDQPICRQGLRHILDRAHDLCVCAEAEDIAGALNAIKHDAPDLLIVEIDLFKGDGIQLVREVHVRHPQLPILILSSCDEEIYAQRMLSAGASGYIMKHTDSVQLVVAIRRVLAGGVYVSKSIGNHLIQKSMTGKEPTGIHETVQLSNRELQILQMIGKGLSTRDTANLLHLSSKTVESHRQRIKRKLNLKTGVQLVHYAVSWNEPAAPGPALQWQSYNDHLRARP